MRSFVVTRLLVLCALIALPGVGYAQEAVLSGTVTDSTAAVLPGVTVVAVHQATGNRFEAVTDELGRYRLPARIGAYQITAELAGFATVTRSNIEIQVGQTAVINLQMSPSTLQESVTVTAEAPLLDVATSSLGGNIDDRQMSELPVQGRDWTSLALLAPGNRTTAMGGTPVQDRADVREFQLNMDGQQVTQNMGTGNQPLYSRDSIAEFQFISNRFDASQGRSSGVQVNAVTKSGTNNVSGSFSGNFRNSDWNAEDHVLNEKLPYENQQLSGTLGGPIMRDRLHFFGNYEYDRTPKTSIWNTPYEFFNVSLAGKEMKQMGGVRLDYQVSPSTRLMGKVHRAKHDDPFTAGNNNHPAATDRRVATSNEYLAQLTQVIGNNALNEIKVGYAGYDLDQVQLTTWSNHWQAANGITQGHPRVTFTGFTVAGNSNAPRLRQQQMTSVRDDFTYSFNARGRHDLKLGGEYLHYHEFTRNCSNCGGRVTANRGPRPDAALMQRIFPDVWDADTWRLDLIPGNLISRYEIGVSDTFETPFTSPRIAAYLQDDWHVTDTLTLNLGLRYDLTRNGWGNDAQVEPFLEAGRPDDANNIQPRLGFAYQLSEATVIRGGAGLYYGDLLSNMPMWTYGNEAIARITIPYDGRADFATNPFNGPTPSMDQAFARFCHVSNAPGCLPFGPLELAPVSDYAHVTNSWQTSIGFQHQLTPLMAFEADYVYNRSRNEKSLQENINISFDPATGVNYPFSDVSRRPYPLFGPIGMTPFTGKSAYHGLQTGLTKRLSDRWQGSVTYTLSGLWNEDPLPMSGLRQVDIDVAPDLGGEWTLAPSDQRHRVVFNGIWQVVGGFQVSGLYFYGSGERVETSYGGDLRDTASGTYSARLRPDGTIVPRNNFVGEPIHRVDMRLQQRIPLGRVSLDGIVELFNLFDRSNFGEWETEESSGSFGEPLQSTNLAYAPRTVQLGFRLTF
jgi:hypothetical protein